MICFQKTMATPLTYIPSTNNDDTVDILSLTNKALKGSCAHIY